MNDVEAGTSAPALGGEALSFAISADLAAPAISSQSSGGMLYSSRCEHLLFVSLGSHPRRDCWAVFGCRRPIMAEQGFRCVHGSRNDNTRLDQNRVAFLYEYPYLQYVVS